MEEIYIIKLKGLPASSQESLRDNKASFYYRKDLTGEALLGFGIMHTFIGLLLIVLTTINLFRIKFTSITVLGSGIWCGAIFAITGFMAIITAHKRKTDISKSKIQVKIFFSLSVVTSLLTITYFILLIFDLKEETFNQYIESNIIMAFIFELFTSLLSVFTCVRIIWPGSLSFCAKDWPMHQKLKRKIIVSTQIYTNGVKQNEDLIRNLGPNCVISLGSPPTDAIIRSDNYSEKTNCNQFVTICEFCDQNNLEFKSNICDHNIRYHCINEEIIDEQYDSDFDVDNFDTEDNGRDSASKMPDMTDHYLNPNDCSHESENKYETIDGIRGSDDNNCCLDNNPSDDKSDEDIEVVQSVDDSKQVITDNQLATTPTLETNDLPKTCEKSTECLTDV